MDSTLLDIIRQTLIIYLYGRYDLMALVERGEHDFTLNANKMFSVSEKFKIQNSKFKIQNSKFKIQNSKFKIQNSKFKIQNSKFKI
ncbi:MAG: hypothetical protein GY694_08155, partial [Gammaproteobacteria bacterium]|nr:hypothetical protein [Gammaproteobacteria bacterium]